MASTYYTAIYICGDKANKQEITTIDLSDNDLTIASSPLIGDIITYLQPHTLELDDNNITSVRDISTAVINTNTVKVLDMRDNDLTAQEASAISDMMTCLEELYISDNKLGDDGAVIISRGITETNTLRILDIGNNKITDTGATAIKNSLLHNTSLEELDIDRNLIGEFCAGEFVVVARNTLKKLSFCGITCTGTSLSLGSKVYRKLIIIVMNNLYYNNNITELYLPQGVEFYDYDELIIDYTITDVKREVELINCTRKHNIQELKIY